jgi:hypothetical protein
LPEDLNQFIARKRQAGVILDFGLDHCHNTTIAEDKTRLFLRSMITTQRMEGKLLSQCNAIRINELSSSALDFRPIGILKSYHPISPKRPKPNITSLENSWKFPCGIQSSPN